MLSRLMFLSLVILAFFVFYFFINNHNRSYDCVYKEPGFSLDDAKNVLRKSIDIDLSDILFIGSSTAEDVYSYKLKSSKNTFLVAIDKSGCVLEIEGLN